jgi:hypothetical protein
MRDLSSRSHPVVTAAEDHVLMHAWWKWLIAATVVVPLVAYVTGSLVAARSVPTQREPIMIMVDPSSSTTTPAPTPIPTARPSRTPSRTPSPTPSTPSPSGVERGPETVRPSPHDLDDDEPDALDDDEADDRTDDETEDDD